MQFETVRVGLPEGNKSVSFSGFSLYLTFGWHELCMAAVLSLTVAINTGLMLFRLNRNTKCLHDVRATETIKIP